jgi:hypothetical protein
MYSFLFVTATWAAGQAPAPPMPTYSAQPQMVQVLPAHEGTHGRVRGLFQRRPQAVAPVEWRSYPQPVPPGPTSPYASPRRQPVPPLAAPPVGEAVTAYRPDLEVRPAVAAQVGHEPNYSSITGHLHYVRADGGRWVLRYAGLDQEDRYGGSVVLAPAVEMRNFREGDLVRVYGEVLEGGRVSRSLGGAHYRVNAISMVERGDGGK